MSLSPTDLAAGWTFVSSSSELNEEMQNADFDAAGDRSNPDEGCVDTKKDTNLDIGKTEEGASSQNPEELEDDLSSVSSESESLPSSDVDVLEESVGPDHDILEMSSSSHASTFSITSPLEGLPGFHHSGSMCINSESPETKEVDATTNQDIVCQSEEPVPSELSLVKSPKSLAEVAASAQVAQSSNTPDTSSHSESKDHPQDTIYVKNSSQTLDKLSRSESKEVLQEQKQKPSKTLDSLSHSKPEELLQEQKEKPSKTPDSLSHSKPKELLPEQKQKPSKTSDSLSHSKPKELLQEQKQEPSKTSDSLSHSKPKELSQEQISEHKPVKTKQRSAQKIKKRREDSTLKYFIVDLFDFMRECSIELTYVMVYFIVWVATVLVIFLLLPGASDMGYLSIDAAKELKYAQDETLKCLGLQHLTAVENNHYAMLLTNVCMNDSAAWKGMFEHLFQEKALKNVIHDVYHETSVEKKTEIIEKFASHTRTNMEGIRLDLLMLQMEHLELLDTTEENVHVKEKNKSSVMPDLLSEKLEEQEGILNQLLMFIERLKLANFALKSLDAELKMADTDEKHTDLIALKPRFYRMELENAFLTYRLQHMLDEFENGEFLDPEYWLGSFNLNNALNKIGSSTVEELVEKVNYLLSSNDEMRGLYSHFSVMKQHLKSGDNKETNMEFSETQIENLKALIKELLGVHHSISGELLEVKKWNEMLAAITSELRNTHEDVNGGYWNWSSIKRAFKGMFSDTQQNLVDILKDIKHLDISEFFSYAEEGGQPFMKEMFESVSSFWRKTSMKSKEFFVKAFHEFGADFTKMFSSLGSHDETHVESQELPEKSETAGESVSETDPSGVPHDSSSNQESSTSDYKDDWDKFKSDWLFQRAANREILRHTAGMKPMNWYLRRGHSMWHSRMTREQEELLQKMEASSYPQHAKHYSKESKDQK